MSMMGFTAQDNHHAAARFNDVALFTTSSTTFVDVTNATVNITIPRAGRIVAFFFGEIWNDTGSEAAHARLVIDGTAGSAIRSLPDSNATPIALIASKGGLAAGTYTVKLQIRSTSGASTARLHKGTDEDNHCEVIFIPE
jgi:hypothetical protein